MHKVLVTGGCGYIGSHTLVDLIENGFEPISIDSNVNSDIKMLQGVKNITGVEVKNYQIDLCDLEKTREVFQAHPDIAGVIHFAAFKSVPESVEKPLMYYRNNLNSLVNVLECIREFKVPTFVFSSSCSVYGNIDHLPVTENTPLPKSECPYANTKKIGEEIIADYALTAETNSILLRYFNPVGAHPSAEIGELPIGEPLNLVPRITQFAIGIRPAFTVFGDDYDTRDGTCIRDYIHVMDIAHAHTKALQYALSGKNKDNLEVFNLGSGQGVTVLEALQAFEKENGIKLDYGIEPRRPGDVVAIYADNKKAKNEFGWETKYGIEDMMRTAWKWELKLKEMQN